VLHVGDISYAVGYLSEWDSFMDQISPVASRVPWMASPGNHEVGWSDSDFTGGDLETWTDSGGECGVPFYMRFPYIDQKSWNTERKPNWTKEAQPWYAFTYELVYFVMLSSEHDYRKGSPQHSWLVKTLKSVDREVTPWLVVTFHRPMYIASSFRGDHTVGQLLEDSLEPLLIYHEVDFVLSGHHHSYQRLCPLRRGKCDPEGGIRHWVIGMAGYSHSRLNSSDPILEKGSVKEWGVTKWVVNRTHATMQYFNGKDFSVVDEFTFAKAESQKHMVNLIV